MKKFNTKGLESNHYSKTLSDGGVEGNSDLKWKKCYRTILKKVRDLFGQHQAYS